MPSPHNVKLESIRVKEETLLGIVKSSIDVGNDLAGRNTRTSTYSPSRTSTERTMRNSSPLSKQFSAIRSPGVSSSGFSPPKSIQRRSVGGTAIVLTANPNAIMIREPKMEEGQSHVNINIQEDLESDTQEGHSTSCGPYNSSSSHEDNKDILLSKQRKPISQSASVLADSFGSPPPTDGNRAVARPPQAPYSHGYPPHPHYGYPMRSPAEYAHHMHMQYAAGYVHDMYHRHHMSMGSPPPYHPYYPHPHHDGTASSQSHHEQWNCGAKRPGAEKDSDKHGGEAKKNVKEEMTPSKETPLIPSPPPKKRKIIGSWDEHDPHDHVPAASPGIFRSPIHNGRMKVKGFGFDYRRSPIIDGTPGRFDLSDPNLRIDTPGGTKNLEDSLFSKSFDEGGLSFDANEGLAASPKMSFDDMEMQEPPQPSPSNALIFNLSPLGNHEFSPFPRHDIIDDNVTGRPKDDSIDEDFPLGFRKFGFSPLPLRQRRSPIKQSITRQPFIAMPRKADLRKADLPSVLEPVKSSPNSGDLSFHPASSLPHHHSHPSQFGSPPPQFRMEFGRVSSMPMSEPRKDHVGAKAPPPNRTPHHLMQTPAKNRMGMVSTPSAMIRYPDSGPRSGLTPFPVPRSLPPKLTPKAPPSAASTVASTDISAPSSTPRKVHVSVMNDATPIKKKSSKPHRRKPCTCKKSKCLKLYCECFAAQIMCEGCNCMDCHNTPIHEAVRVKAMKDTKLKNPSAFEVRVNKNENSHSTGCKCKKSKCLKKYCECFESGIVCGSKCKCENCKNFAGSDELLQRRRKIKDHKGAEEVIRQKANSDDQKTPGQNAIPNQPQPLYPLSLPVQAQHHLNMMLRSPYGYNLWQQQNGMQSPLGVPPGTPGYQRYYPTYPTPQARPGIGNQMKTPQSKTPKTPVARRDPLSAKKSKNSEKDVKKECFGPKNGIQEKRAAIGILSFLSNEELYNASIVSKTWSSLATDDELWQFD